MQLPFLTKEANDQFRELWIEISRFLVFMQKLLCYEL